MPAWVYILRLQSGGLYVGSTVDLKRRIQDHFRGQGCRTTRLDRPSELVCQERYDTIEQAERREYQIKHWKRAKKEALIRRDMRALRTLAKRRGT